MKKAVFVIVIAIMMLSMLSVTAFAHGGHKKSAKTRDRQLCYEMCEKDGCDILGAHRHSGVWYCSQAGDCANHEICTVEDCSQHYLHEHDGVYYRYAGFAKSSHGCGKGRSR